MGTKALEIRITGDNSALKRAIMGSIGDVTRLDQAHATGTRKRKANEVALSADIEKILKQTTEATKREAKEAEKAKEKEYAGIARLAQKSTDEESKVFQRSAREKETAMRRAAENQVKMSQKQRDESVKASQLQAKAAEKGFNLSRFAANQFKDALGSVAGQFTLLNVGQAAFSAMTQMWDSWKTDSLEAAKNISNVREQLLELAALKGRLGDTTTENMEQINFRAKTLQTDEASRAYQSEFINVSQSGVDAGLISKSENEKLMAEGGKFQAAEGGDAATHARLAGSLPSLLGKKPGGGQWTAEEISQHEQKLYNQMQRGNFTFSGGAAQLVGAQGLLGTGAFGQGPEAIHQLSAMHTALSNQTDPTKAGTLVSQVTDALTGSQRRMRGPTTDHQEGDSKMAQFYTSIGAGAESNLTTPEIAKKLFAYFDEQQKAGGKLGEGDNLWHLMQGKGFMNRESIEGIGALYKAHQTGQYDTHMERAGTDTGMLGSETNDPDYVSYDERMKRFESGPVADKRRTEIGKRGTDTSLGLKSETYNALREQAFNLLKQQGHATGDSWESYAKDNVFGGAEKLDATINQMAAQEAERVNAPSFSGQKAIKGYSPFITQTYSFGDAGSIGRKSSIGDDYAPWDDGSDRARRYSDVADKIGSEGGNLSAAFLREIAKNTAAQTKIAQEQERKRSGVRPQLNAAPAPGMRNAGR